MHRDEKVSLTHSPPPLLSPQDHQRITAQIDSLLQNDFAVLSRHPHTPQQALLTAQNNPLLLHYVNNIYHQYRLPDPLPKRYSSKVPPSQEKTRTAKIKVSQIHPHNDYETPPRQNHFERKGEVHPKGTSPEYQTVPTRVTEFSPDKEVESEMTVKMQVAQSPNTVRTGSQYFSNNKEQMKLSSRQPHPDQQMPITFSQLQRQFQPVESGSALGQSSLPSQVKPQPQSLIRIETPQEANSQEVGFVAPAPLPQIVSPHLPLQQIKETFRYCIGCERALLEANIAVHEESCGEFKRVLGMSMGEIVEYLKRKIAIFEGNIEQYSKELLRVDPNKMGEHSRRLMEESQWIVRHGSISEQYEREYGQTLSMSSKWCMMAEEINKVNWFLKIRARLKRSASL